MNADFAEGGPPTSSGYTVIKIGGTALQSGDGLLREIAELFQAMPLVLVHGGGKSVSKWLGRLEIMPEFVGGHRKTDAETLEVVASLLAGKINSELVTALKLLGAPAVGFSGASFMLGKAEKEELGYVAMNAEADATAADLMSNLRGFLPVVAPLVRNTERGDVPMLNMNADTFAGCLAGAVAAVRLILVTDQEGVLDKHKRLIPHMTGTQARELVDGGVAIGGMIPKLEAGLKFLKSNPGASVCIVGPEQLGPAARGERVGTAIVGTRT